MTDQSTKNRNATADRNFPHRTRANVAAIQGLASSIMSLACRIEMIAKNGRPDGETQLQLALADMMADANAIDAAIAGNGQ